MKIIASNFKTNHTRASTKVFIESIGAVGDGVYVFPPATALDKFDSDVIIGAQNAYPAKNGSFTGEIGLEQLSEFGIKTILIGHSERRHVLGEMQELIPAKFSFFAEHDFTIFYCIGEPLEIREAGIDAVLEYCYSQLEGIDLGYKKLVVAYEPVWAIGTGKVATKEQINSTHNALKKIIQKPLLYGGSVKPSNIDEILSIKNVDGVLVGTASWVIEDFKAMIEIAKKY